MKLEYEKNRGRVVAVKHDSGKAPLSIIPPAALVAEAQALSYGSRKYSKNNYKLGMDYCRYADAALRHIVAWSHGEDTDPESGLSHLGHARASLAMLIHNIDAKTGKDDR